MSLRQLTTDPTTGRSPIRLAKLDPIDLHEASLHANTPLAKRIYNEHRHNYLTKSGMPGTLNAITETRRITGEYYYNRDADGQTSEADLRAADYYNHLIESKDNSPSRPSTAPHTATEMADVRELRPEDSFLAGSPRRGQRPQSSDGDAVPPSDYHRFLDPIFIKQHHSFCCDTIMDFWGALELKTPAQRFSDWPQTPAPSAVLATASPYNVRMLHKAILRLLPRISQEEPPTRLDVREYHDVVLGAWKTDNWDSEMKISARAVPPTRVQVLRRLLAVYTKGIVAAESEAMAKEEKLFYSRFGAQSAPVSRLINSIRQSNTPSLNSSVKTTPAPQPTQAPLRPLSAGQSRSFTQFGGAYENSTHPSSPSFHSAPTLHSHNQYSVDNNLRRELIQLRKKDPLEGLSIIRPKSSTERQEPDNPYNNFFFNHSANGQMSGFSAAEPPNNEEEPSVQQLVTRQRPSSAATTYNRSRSSQLYPQTYGKGNDAQAYAYYSATLAQRVAERRKPGSTSAQPSAAPDDFDATQEEETRIRQKTIEEENKRLESARQEMAERDRLNARRNAESAEEEARDVIMALEHALWARLAAEMNRMWTECMVFEAYKRGEDETLARQQALATLASENARAEAEKAALTAVQQGDSDIPEGHQTEAQPPHRDSLPAVEEAEPGQEPVDEYELLLLTNPKYLERKFKLMEEELLKKESAERHDIEYDSLKGFLRISNLDVYLKEEASEREYIMNTLEPGARNEIAIKLVCSGMKIFPEQQRLLGTSYVERYSIECAESKDRAALKMIGKELAEMARDHAAASLIQRNVRRYLDSPRRAYHIHSISNTSVIPAEEITEEEAIYMYEAAAHVQRPPVFSTVRQRLNESDELSTSPERGSASDVAGRESQGRPRVRAAAVAESARNDAAIRIQSQWRKHVAVEETRRLRNAAGGIRDEGVLEELIGQGEMEQLCLLVNSPLPETVVGGVISQERDMRIRIEHQEEGERATMTGSPIPAGLDIDDEFSRAQQRAREDLYTEARDTLAHIVWEEIMLLMEISRMHCDEMLRISRDAANTGLYKSLTNTPQNTEELADLARSFVDDILTGVLEGDHAGCRSTTCSRPSSAVCLNAYREQRSPAAAGFASVNGPAAGVRGTF